MPDSYAYIISNNKIEPIFTRVRSAAKPERFTRDTLNTWGFTASNDRAMVSVMKMLGFINEAGAPTEYYDRLRDPNDWRYVLAERIRAAYSDLFAIDSNMNVAPEGEVRGAISRITGKDEESVGRYYSTFKTLAGLGKFEPKPSRTSEATKPSPTEETTVSLATTKTEHPEEPPHRRRSEYHYNIQIHLPVTTDISVYNAIFKSLKENLGI
ncbi:hypothetical protein LMG19087_03007 [Ralstonia wenshanensis]|uniref:DUF5343 domain-containing protein n=1 Tax=Ralstonia wenshanensis TaxID=2842456 RepID=UPI0028F64732|nr:DUF5343 domain-containing protein [Ralstonia wenshanensis]CAJ0817168.1 hypothetical protein LMG19087_03007 [Ralstonia wenshanensis]